MGIKPLVVGNWKMHKTLAETLSYIQMAGESLHQLQHVEVVLCVPFTSLSIAEGLLRETRVGLGIQNVAAWKEGSYTGEIAASMVAGHCQYVLLGHSERRRWLGETSQMIKDKVECALAVGLKPIVCVSSEEEIAALAPVKDTVPPIIIAFEPLEAIGSGKPSDPDEVRRFNKLIWQYLGSDTRVIYGGSVDETNVSQFIKVCDGVLPGKASLDPGQFLALCREAEKASS